MSPSVRHRIWQAALTLGALLITILAPLSGTASYAAAPNTGDTSATGRVSAPGSTESSITAMIPNAVAAAAIPAVAASTQFDITGFLQSATVDAACVAAAGASLDVQGNPKVAHCGGTAQINGHTIIVPAETIVILPANALTWQELFVHAPAPYGFGGAATNNADNSNNTTGMALNDVPKPPTTYEVQMIGNRVIGGGQDRYIAGLVHVSQQDLNSGAGYINCMNYATGEMRVGGTPGSCANGTRVRINDPAVVDTNNDGIPDTGRYGRANTPDDRFQVDQDNPTILAETGFPMCFPRTLADPNIAGNADDPLCPRANRPVISSPVVDTSDIVPQPNTLIANQFYTVFRMDSPANVDANTCRTASGLARPCTDPRKQAPFEVGDYVTFAGTLIQDGGANGGYYISAHTITASLGIYTQPGIDPAYVSIEVALIGTGGLTVFGAGEAAVRTRFEGMSTDETRLVRLYGIDINPLGQDGVAGTADDGQTSDREWGTIKPDIGPPTGAVRGRWRFRPPCTATVATDKACTPPPAGQFIPPTREVRAVIDGLSQFQPGTIVPNPNSQVPGSGPEKFSANGINYGQYHAPIGEYIFPENVPGTAVPENNFNTINFLSYGGYTSITGVQAGVLSPWPSSVNPPPLVCATVTLNGAPYSVANGGTIQLSGSVAAGANTPVTVKWTAGTGVLGSANENDLAGALTNSSTTTPSFNATGLAAGVYNVNFEAANICGVSVASSTITVQAAPPPTINPIQNQTVTAGNPVTIIATSASLPAPTWAWAQTGGPAAVAIAQTPAAGTATGSSRIDFPTAGLPIGTYTFSVAATNVNGTSPNTNVSVTLTTAVPATITFGGTLEYRISKQRLVMTATSTNPAITSMVLQPYLTESGTIFDPATLGANLSVSLITPGSWTITAVGAPRPACNLGGAYATPCSQTPITVKGYTLINGVNTLTDTSAPTAMQKIRQ
jgi:hypothetical protein